jgi:hypothetical protein
MTTYPLGREDKALSDALYELAGGPVPDHAIKAALSELGAAAAPGNGWPGPASVPWAVRPHLAGLLRDAAEGHPLSGELEGLADGLEDSYRMHRTNSR